MADPTHDVERVGLQALSSAAAVPVAAPSELARDLLRSHGHGRRHALEDGHESLPVGLPGGEHPEHGSIVSDPIARLGKCGGGASAAPAAGDRSPRGRIAGAISAR